MTNIDDDPLMVIDIDPDEYEVVEERTPEEFYASQNINNEGSNPFSNVFKQNTDREIYALLETHSKLLELYGGNMDYIVGEIEKLKKYNKASGIVLKVFSIIAIGCGLLITILNIIGVF